MVWFGTRPQHLHNNFEIVVHIPGQFRDWGPVLPPVNSIFTALDLDFWGTFYILIRNAVHLKLTHFLIQHFIHKKLVSQWPIFIVYLVYTHPRKCDTFKTSIDWPVSEPYTQLFLVTVFFNLNLFIGLEKYFLTFLGVTMFSKTIR